MPYTIETNEQGLTYVNENGDILVRDSATDSQIWVPQNQIHLIEEQSVEPVHDEVETTEDKTPECSKNWSTSNTLLLIDIFKKYEDSFNTDLKKNIWHKITNDINVKTGGMLSVANVENKWKSLKRTYGSLKIKMGRSGSQKRYWQYFNAMDDILAKRPEITPPAVVSSSLGVVSQQPGTSTELTSEAESGNVEESEGIEEPPRKKFFKKKNAPNVNDRHREKLERQDRFLNLFEKLVDKM